MLHMGAKCVLVCELTDTHDLSLLLLLSSWISDEVLVPVSYTKGCVGEFVISAERRANMSKRPLGDKDLRIGPKPFCLSGFAFVFMF